MELKTYFAQDAAGNIISSAIVNVFLQGTTTLATGLTRADGTPLENPFAADGAGRIQFRAPDGYYDVQVSAGPGIIQTLTIQCVDYSGAKADADRAEAAADRSDVSAEQAQNALNSITGINTNFEQNSREQWRRSLAEEGLTLVSGSFEEGATVNSKTDAVWHISVGQCYTWHGAFPKTVPADSTPESSGGVGGGKWVGVGDASLRSHLASKLGYSLIGELDSVSGFYGLYGEDNSRVKLKSWSSDYILVTGGKPTGGGEFIFVPTMPKTSHNGGTIISPSVPYSSISSFLSGTGESDPSGSGCWVRDFDGPINALWFGAVGDGTTDNSAQLAAFRDAVVNQTAKRRGYIPAGTYAYATGPNYAVKGVHIFGDGKNNTILKNTSGERAFRIDGSEYGQAAVYDVVVENIGIEGHAGTQHLFYVENASHLTARNINLREASPTTGRIMSLLWTVASVFENITYSINEQPVTNRPYYGIVLSNSPSRGLKSTANLFINTIIEGVGGAGIRLDNTDLNTFIGGTSEANGTYGITTAGESRQNKFVGMGFEGNGTADLLDGGQDTVLENCYTGKSIVLLSSSRRARIVGGLHERIEMQLGCSAANIENLTVNYFDTGSGGIYDSGTNSSFRNIFDLDANAYVYPTKLRQPIQVTDSPFTYTNTTGEYQNVLTTGGTVTAIQFSRGGSHTLTGMTTGFVMLAPGDSLIVSYAVAPTMSRVPMGNNNA